MRRKPDFFGVPWLLLELSAVVVTLHGIAAVCTEFVFQTEGFVFGLFYTFAQCFTFMVLALVQSMVRGLPGLSFSAIRGSAVAGYAVPVSHGCGILSYVYVNYTTAMVFKSAKVPSVLIGARLVNKTATTARELLWAFCMMIGLLLFASGDVRESARFTPLGLLLIAVNLVGSTLTANLQQVVLQPQNLQASSACAPCVHGVMLVQYAVAAGVLLVHTLITGEFAEALRWYFQNRPASFFTCLDNILTYLGLEAVMCITKEFDAARGESLAELEQLSGAKILVSDEAVDGQYAVKIEGKPVAVSRARVLLEDKLLHAPGGKEEAPVIAIAGRPFKDREELVGHIRSIQAATPDGSLLGPEDAFFVFHLATFHPNFVEKMTAPVVGFKYGPHEAFVGNKCFSVVRADGSEEGISVMKCVESALPKKGQGRGTKRDREDGDRDELAKDSAHAGGEEPPAAKPRREMQAGCVLIIEGLPGSCCYEEVKEALKAFGDVRFVEFLRDGPSASKAEAKEEATEMSGDEVEGGEEHLCVEADAEAETCDTEMTSARARFADAEAATAAAEGFKELDGNVLSCRVLDGEEEKQFWERLWQKAESRQAKGKGKWSKDRKGKGKKGKGKGKRTK
ncbi:UTR2 [Symbiodinium pilosum]|uniref:UTR2 protein n=1 Tax=Symbiodinium pilosum TaxID=2952 RepID=A0A812T5R8_SYMPI|nr:UTR2 [Symbiodinium pilosum]